MKLATWNVNSLRVRLPHLLDWLAANPSVDVVGIQETKLEDHAFPAAEIEAAGLQWVHSGQKTYNGVAILSRHALTEVTRDLAGFDDLQKRVITATVAHPAGTLRFVNAYVVNGQAVGSEKYEYKLRFLKALHDVLKAELAAHPRLALVGDYNIAPAPEDTHDPAVWEGQILCSEPERQAFGDLLALGLADSFRLLPQPPGTFTWWDYRAAGFRRGLGLRIDHVLASKALADRCTAVTVDLAPRRLERPSDHAPVIAEFAD